MSMNINVGHDNVVYMTPSVDMSLIVFVWTLWSLLTVSNITSCLPDESLVRRVWVHGCVPPGGGQLHQDIRPPHSGEQGVMM